MNTLVCSIEGCGKAVKAQGWCNAHYRRSLAYGDPLGGGAYKGEAIAFLESAVLSFDGDECLIWPFGRDGNGRGQIWCDGRQRPVHRIACEHEHGPPPTPKHEAAHSCGKGHEGCCNRKHLEWKTRAENEADKLLHGTHNRGERNSAAKLTESQVLEIRASIKSHRELAVKFGISQVHVSNIKARRKWAWLNDNTPPAATEQPGRRVGGLDVPHAGVADTFDHTKFRFVHKT